MLKVGLTGGIASGKTAVADAFSALDAPVIDTDELSREVAVRGSEGLQAIVDAFGEDYLDAAGELDREKLRGRVFADPAARKRLEAIVHPRVQASLRERLARLEAPYAIIAVPLLLETGMDKDVDRVLVVDCSETMQIERLMARDGERASRARAILRAQTDRISRLAAADDIIKNDGSLAALQYKVRELDERYRRMN
jgi:dephospho-CoA kinase